MKEQADPFFIAREHSVYPSRRGRQYFPVNDYFPGPSPHILTQQHDRK